MATNSNVFSGSTNAKYQVLYLVFNQVSQDIANNRTLFSYESYIQGKSGGSGSSTAGSHSITGATTTSASGQSWSWNTTTKQTIATGSFYVSHNSDGTLATQTLSISVSFKTTSGTLSSSTSVSLAVPTIPRYAAVTGFTVSINDLSASLSWTADKTISQWRWSSNNGASYSGWITVNATSSSIPVGVSPGSTYGFQIQVRSSASGLDTTSSTVSKTATKTPSTLSLSTTSQYVGNNINWTVNESYDYTHTITYAFGNTSGWILGSAASNTASGAWTVPMALANQIPNATSGSGTIYVYTYYGGVHVGTNSYTFTAVVPDNVTFQPTASISSIVEAGETPSWMTVFVQNKSKFKVTSSGTGKYNSTINIYSVSVAGIGTYYGSDITSAFLKNSGSVRVTLTVTDSRGLSGSTFQDITVVAYSPPQIPTFNASRSESTPANISASFNASISPIDNQNNKYFRIRSKASDGGWVEETDSTQSYTFSGTQTIVSNPDKSYTIEFFVQDAFTSVTQTVQVGTAFTLIDFNASGKGMAIGKVSESDRFEVALPAEFTNPIKVQGHTQFTRKDYSINTPSSGWYRIAWSSNTGRGAIRIGVYTSGGNWSPGYAELFGFHDWSTYGDIPFSFRSGGYVTEARYTTDGTNTYLECWFSQHFNGGLIMYDAGYNAYNAYSGTLPSGGGTVHVTKDIALTTGGGPSSVSWNDILSKPSTFAPSAHNQAWSTITSPPAQATRWPTWAEVTGKPSTFAPATHTHGVTRTTILGTTAFALNGTYNISQSIQNFDLIIMYISIYYNSASDNNSQVVAFSPSSLDYGSVLSGGYDFGTNRQYGLFFPNATQIKCITAVNLYQPRVKIEGINYTS